MGRPAEMASAFLWCLLVEAGVYGYACLTFRVVP